MTNLNANSSMFIHEQLYIIWLLTVDTTVRLHVWKQLFNTLLNILNSVCSVDRVDSKNLLSLAFNP